MEIVSFRQASSSLIFKCAELYCEIWKEPPWNEDFWKPEEVRLEIDQQLQKACAEGFLCVDNEAVKGFTWAYSVTRKEMEAICGSRRLDVLFSNQHQVFYIDELAVSRFSRRQGIGESLTRAVLSELKKYGPCLITLRTDKKALAARSLYQKLGFKDLLIEDKQYPDRTYWILGI